MTRCLQVPPQEAKRRKTVVMVGGMAVWWCGGMMILLGGTYVVRYVPRLPHYRAHRTSMRARASPLSRSHLLLLHPNFQLPLLSSTTGTTLYIGTSYW